MSAATASLLAVSSHRLDASIIDMKRYLVGSVAYSYFAVCLRRQTSRHASRRPKKRQSPSRWRARRSVFWLSLLFSSLSLHRNTRVLSLLDCCSLIGAQFAQIQIGIPSVSRDLTLKYALHLLSVRRKRERETSCCLIFT